MQILQIAAISFALSQLVLSVMLLLGSRPWLVQQKLYALLLAAIACYLLEPLVEPPLLHFLLVSFTTAVPGMFWLFSASLFDDHFELARWQLALVAATVILPFIGRLLNMLDITALDLLLFTLPQGLEFLLLAMTLFVVARYWQVDLVESRRRLRLWFCGLNGLYIFVLLLMREWLLSDAPWFYSVQFLPVGGILLAANAILLCYRQEVWAPSLQLGEAPAVAVEAEVAEVEAAEVEVMVAVTDREPGIEIDQRLLDKLNDLVERQHAYREMGLTIGQLAAQLQVPEYRLRQMINAGLGYRNFNDFLNRFRVAEAASRLADPEQGEVQILAIALDAGYRSLSSFNKAFKASLGMTPTAYRRQHLS